MSKAARVTAIEARTSGCSCSRGGVPPRLVPINTGCVRERWCSSNVTRLTGSRTPGGRCSRPSTSMCRRPTHRAATSARLVRADKRRAQLRRAAGRLAHSVYDPMTPFSRCSRLRGSFPRRSLPGGPLPRRALPRNLGAFLPRLGEPDRDCLLAALDAPTLAAAPGPQRPLLAPPHRARDALPGTPSIAPMR
jgi:hypothetical protein